jgi:hypothetical protein
MSCFFEMYSVIYKYTVLLVDTQFWYASAIVKDLRPTPPRSSRMVRYTSGSGSIINQVAGS